MYVLIAPLLYYTTSVQVLIREANRSHKCIADRAGFQFSQTKRAEDVLIIPSPTRRKKEVRLTRTPSLENAKSTPKTKGKNVRNMIIYCLRMACNASYHVCTTRNISKTQRPGACQFPALDEKIHPNVFYGEGVTHNPSLSAYTIAHARFNAILQSMHTRSREWIIIIPSSVRSHHLNPKGGSISCSSSLLYYKGMK